MRGNSSPGLDLGFVGRVCVATAGLSLVILLCLLGRVELAWICGFLLGDALALALLKSNELIAARLMQRRPERPGRWLVMVQLGKYPLVAALLYAAVMPLHLPPVAILCGYGMVQAVILLKLAGRALSNRSNRRKPAEPSNLEENGGA
jgi:polyferredoxin